MDDYVRINVAAMLAAAKMPKIQQFPTEVLEQIFENLLHLKQHVAYLVLPLHQPHEASIAALRALSLTCRSFHKAAQPLLWRHICFKREIDATHVAFPTAKQLVALIRLWRARPDIASHVQTLYVPWPELYFHVNPGLENNVSRQDIDDEDRVFMSGVVKDIGLRVDDNEFEGPKIIGLIALTAVLLARKVRIVDLWIEGTVEIFNSIPAAGETSLSLEHLKEARVSNLVGEDSLAVVARLLQLAPNLTRLNSYRPRYVSIGKGGIDWSNITSITFTHSFLVTHELVEVITACRGLIEFEHMYTYGTPHIVATEVLAALATHSRTLRKLCITFDNGASYNANTDSIGSMAPFTGLKELVISGWEMGSGDDCLLKTLPASLERLGFDIDGYPEKIHVPDVERFAESIKRGDHPALQEVHLPGWECDGDHPGPCRGGYVGGDQEFVEGVDMHEDWEYDEDDQEEGCDGGKTVTDLKALLLDAGVKCTIG